MFTEPAPGSELGTAYLLPLWKEGDLCHLAYTCQVPRLFDPGSL